MDRPPWLLAGVGVLGSLLVSVLAWVVFGTPALFLFVPIVPFLFRGSATRRNGTTHRCPRCDFRTSEPGVQYCPRDGTELETG